MPASPSAGPDGRCGSGTPAARPPLVFLPRIRPAGPRALLIETPGAAAAAALHTRLLRDPLPGQMESVPAARTVLLRLATPAHARQAATLLDAEPPAFPADGSTDGPLVELDTVYDGEDLAEVARLTGLGSAEAVAAAHSAAVWSAAFSGFAPGFAYLTGGDPRLDVPRRAEPRTRVPAGAVALAGRYSAAYPRESPGGWQLIGRTAALLWNLERDSPALITPGTRVRFRRVRELLHVRAEAGGGPGGAAGVPAPEPSEPAVPGSVPPLSGSVPVPAAVVVAPGPQATVQDLGRAGYRSIGVGMSGAADRSALLRGNRLVGNPPGSAAVEVLFGGLQIRAERDLLLAVTGADAPLTVRSPEEHTGRSPEEHMEQPDRPFLLRAGAVLSLGVPAAGLRTYLTIRGGVDVPPVLGSRATDVLAGLGPAPLAAGSGLPVGPEPRTAVGLAEIPPGLPGDEIRLHYVPGPREDWFSPAEIASFQEQAWTVGSRSNRVGIRLAGTPLAGRRTGELDSEAVLPGSVQVPPSGEPILFLADAPVTGGYPVIGTVLDADLDHAAQLRPGARVRFVAVPLQPDSAVTVRS